MKKLLLIKVFFLSLFMAYGQVSKTNTISGTITNVPASGAHIDRTFTYNASDFTACTGLSEVEISIRLILGNGTPPTPGAYGVHEDLNVRLVSPTGTAIDLVQDRWGYWTGNSSQTASYNSFAAVDGTVHFDDDHPQNIAPVGPGANDWITGNFSPHNALSGFDGENPVGTWTLRISDGNSQLAASDYVHFVEATLSVTCGTSCTEPTIPTVSATPSTICNGGSTTLNISGTLNDATQWHIYTGFCGVTQVGTTAGSTFSVSPTTTTTYYIRGEGGCTTPGTCGTVTVTVDPAEDASFSYSAASYCVNDPDPTPTVTGVGGGTFSSTAGLSLNGSTGAIDVSASTPGTYTVTYTTPGTCTGTSNQSVTINALDDPSFNYSAAAYCQNDPDPTPTITGLVGGTFSSTAGLTITATTGVVDVSASTPGTYLITYTTSGACPNSASVSMQINGLEDASFTYSAASYCSSDSDPTPTVTGFSPGSFSSTVGLSINAFTGTVDLSASTPGTYTVTYTTSGTCPNSSNVSLTVTALDDASFNYSAAAYCTNDANPTPTITGVAGGAFSSTAGLVFVSAATGEIDLSASTMGTYTVTYTTTGSCSNSSTQSVTITGSPAAPSATSPVSFCPGADVILEGTGSGTGTLNFYDNTMTLLDSAAMPPATGTLNIGALANGTYTYFVAEDNGSCESTMTPIDFLVGDTTDPTAICQDVTIYLDGAGLASITAGDIDGGSTDNCGAVTTSASQTSFDCTDIGGSPAGTLIITGAYDAGLSGGTPKGVELYVANDIADLSQYGLGSANNGGGSDGQEFTFPAVSATAGQFIYVSSEAVQFTNFFGFSPDYTDGSMGINGDDAIELFHMGTVIDVFGDINTDGTGEPWEYLDGWAYRNGGTGPDGTAFALANWSFSGINVYDGQTSNLTSTPPVPIGTFSPASSGSTPVTLTVTDGSGNTSTCTANVTVLDTIAPVVTCPGDQSETLDATCSLTLPDYTGLVIATDNCTASPVITQSPAAGTVISADQLITMTATDDEGNTSTCTFNVTVVDNTAPTAVCQNITVFLDGAGNAVITASDIDGGSTDNCGVPSLSASTTVFTCADLGANNITLTATDGAGNSATCTAVVTVQDSISPVVTCPSDQTEAVSPSCDFTLPDYTGLVTATDNCGVPTVTQSPAAGTVITADQVVTMTATDAEGNSATCTFNVILTGATPPVAVCQDITVYLDGSGNASIVASDIDGGSTATCGGSTLSASNTAFTCADLGANNITLTVTDGLGNTDDCVAVVTVEDTLAPTPDVASLSDITAECSVSSLIDPSVTDNCGTVTVTNDATLPISNQGTTVVTWTYDDGNGNTSTQTQNVVINDVSSPLPTVAPLPDVTGDCSVDALPSAPIAIDACAGSISGVLVTPVTLPITTQGTTVITWEFDDGNGNITTQSQNLVVNDVTGPTPDVATLPDLSEECSLDAPSAPTATDNCTSGVITATTSTSFPMFSSGAIVWEYDDGNGNITTQTQNVTINGIDNSVNVSADGGTLTANLSGAGVTYEWFFCDPQGAIDNETGQSFTPVANGSYQVLITSGGCQEFSPCTEVTTVGLEGLTIDQLSVYPNPSESGFFTVKYDGNIEAIDVVDMLGRIIVLPTDTTTGIVDGSELANGRYMIRVTTEGSVLTTEIVIAR